MVTGSKTFAIITTDPNELTAEVHNRMPVIVHPQNYDRWPERGSVEQPVNLLRPFDADAVKAGACNPLVGNVRNNGPEMLNSALMPGLALL